MGKVKKFFFVITALTLAVAMVFTQPVKVCAATVATDMYSQRATEELVIDDVTYTLHYFYEDGNRAITIENSENSRVEKVTYDPRTATVYYYEGADENVPNDTSGEWVLLGSSSHEVTWGEGVTVAVAAASIAAVLGFCGAASVISTMGYGALSILAASSIGGKIYITTYYMTVPYQGTHYRYIWSFTTPTGDSYGPYEYVSAPGLIS